MTLILNPEGWLGLQNGDVIENMDNKDLVFLIQF